MMTFDVDNLNDMHDELQRFADYLLGCGLTEDDVFFGRLVGCELLTNVIRHCKSAARFCGGMEGGVIVITVASEGAKSFGLCRGLPDVLAESGRGLYIVNAVCNGNVTFSEGGVTARISPGSVLRGRT